MRALARSVGRLRASRRRATLVRGLGLLLMALPLRALLAQGFGEPAEIRVTSARVRTEPTIVAPVVHTLVRGSAVMVTSPGDVWSFIEFGEIRGYVRTEQLLMIRPPAVDSAKRSAAERATRATAGDAAPTSRSRETLRPGTVQQRSSSARWRIEASGLLRSFPYGPSIGDPSQGVRLGNVGGGGELLVHAPFGARGSVGLGASVTTHASARLGTPVSQRATVAALVVEPRAHQELLGGFTAYVAPRLAVQRITFAAGRDSVGSPFSDTHLGGSVSLGGGIERPVTDRVAVIGGMSYALSLHLFRGSAGTTSPLADPLLGNTEWTGRLGVVFRF
ncbi:MAG: hypothetical protein MUF00_16905 [Gemmatimonadaceae bacterium]|nr:hypothetical protein [Gemmatimonadaceae bacterium]